MTGHIHLRVPLGMREQLDALAAAQSISLNALLVAIIAGAIGYRPEVDPDA